MSKKSFRDMTSRIMPDQKMLDAMTRDLSFVPSSATNAISLTKDQIGQFNRNGFLMPLDRSDTKETENLREYFDNLLARVQAAGADSYSIISGQVKHARIYDIA